MSMNENIYGGIILNGVCILGRYLELDAGAGMLLDKESIQPFKDQEKMADYILSDGQEVKKNKIFIAFHSSTRLSDKLKTTKLFKSKGVEVENFTSLAGAYLCHKQEGEELRQSQLLCVVAQHDNLFLLKVDGFDDVEVVGEYLGGADTNVQQTMLERLFDNVISEKKFSEVFLIGDFRRMGELGIKISNILPLSSFEKLDIILAQNKNDFYVKIFKGLWNMNNRIKIGEFPIEKLTEAEMLDTEPKNYIQEINDPNAKTLFTFAPDHPDSYKLTVKDKSLIVSIWERLRTCKDKPIIEANNIFVVEGNKDVFDKVLGGASSYNIYFREFIVNQNKSNSELLDEADALLRNIYGPSYSDFLESEKQY